VREVLREQVTVDRPEQAAWDHLAALERWPSWAGHIRSMDPSPPGALTASTSVKLHMRNGVKATMTVTEYDPPRRWVWEGSSLGTVTRFEHRFEPVGDGRTRIWFLAWMGGPFARPGGWWFGRAMKRYLTRAFPKLKAEIESDVT
jgi:hypothetical protein